MRNQLMLILLYIVTTGVHAQIYESREAKVTLMGKAPKEVITARSQTLKAKLNAATREFIFRQSLNDFLFSQGNIQKKDAEKSYWETHKYPYAEFKGKIVSDVDLTKDGLHKVTCIGLFSLHGVEKEIKVSGEIVVKGNAMAIRSNFRIFLSDYNIEIPRLMTLKVAEEFGCAVNIRLSKK